MGLIKTYLFLPFIISLLFATIGFFKNPIIIRRSLKTFFFIMFFLFFLIFATHQNISFNFFSYSCTLDNISIIFLGLTSFIFLLFSIISKTFILKLHKLFASTLALLFGLINLAIVLDNIFAYLITIFWIFLSNHFLQVSFAQKENKKSLNNELLCNILLILLSAILINLNFSRYFILENITFNFTNISQIIYKISDLTIMPAFIGFLILSFKFFNLCPFNGKKLSNIAKTNQLLEILETPIYTILGTVLILKCFLNFDYLFYQNQNIITGLLVFNVIYYSFLSMKQDRLFKFLQCSFIAINSCAIFTLFSFNTNVGAIFGYYSIAIVLCFCLVALIFMLIAQKQKTDEINKLEKMNDTTKLIPLFLVIALLNFSKAPMFAMFQANLISFITIFSIDYESTFLNITPYILLLSTFILSICGFNLIGKILIEPTETMKNQVSLSNHQIITLTILSLALIIIGFFPQNTIELFGEIYQVSNF